MEPVTVITVVTAAIPFLTALAKKLFRTDKIAEEKRAGVHALIPIIIGILSAGAYEYERSHNLVLSLVVGLSSGGIASSARDIDKNLVGISKFLVSLFKKKDASNK